MNTDDLLALARRHGKVCEVPYDGITFTRAQLQRFVAELRALPSEQPEALALKDGSTINLRSPWVFPDRSRV